MFTIRSPLFLVLFFLGANSFAGQRSALDEHDASQVVDSFNQVKQAVGTQPKTLDCQAPEATPPVHVSYKNLPLGIKEVLAMEGSIVPTTNGGCDGYSFDKKLGSLDEFNGVTADGSKYQTPEVRNGNEVFPRKDATLYRGMGTDQFNPDQAILAMLGDPRQFVGSRAFSAIEESLLHGNSNAMPYLNKFAIAGEFAQLQSCQPKGFNPYFAALYAADLMNKAYRKLSDDYKMNVLMKYNSGRYDNGPDSVIFASVHVKMARQYRETITSFSNDDHRGIDLNFWNYKDHGLWTESFGNTQVDYGEFITPGYMTPEQVQSYSTKDWTLERYEKNGAHYILIFDSLGKREHSVFKGQQAVFNSVKIPVVNLAAALTIGSLGGAIIGQKKAAEGIGRVHTAAGDRFYFLRDENVDRQDAPAPTVKAQTPSDVPNLMGVIELCPDASRSCGPPKDVFSEFPNRSKKSIPSELKSLDKKSLFGYPIRIFSPKDAAN